MDSTRDSLDAGPWVLEWLPSIESKISNFDASASASLDPEIELFQNYISNSLPAGRLDESTVDSVNNGSLDESGVDTVTGLSTLRDDFRSDIFTTAGLGIGAIRSGVIEARGDRDWFAVNLIEGNTYRIRSHRMGLADPLINLRGAAGEILATDDDSAGNYDSLITFSATRSGRHFIDVGAYADAYTGMYLVNISQIGRIADDFSGNINTKGVIAVGRSANGTLETKGDHDWFKVDLIAGQSYEFRLDSQSLYDPYLNLRNSAGISLASNDNGSSTSRNSIIRFTAGSTASYFLDASSSREEFTGSYTLSAITSTRHNGSGYSAVDGYGEANVQRAIQSVIGRTIADVTNINSIFWGLDRIGAPEAWSIGATGAGVTVAVIDTGVDYSHSDLDGNIWMNTREIDGNGIDDDGNGYVDDIRGWDFVDNDNTPYDLNNHGTHIAGIIAAENNNFGQIGVAFNSKIMPVRVLNARGSGSFTGVANGVRYAADNGAHVINLSLGSSTGSVELFNAIRYASTRGSVVVMAAGNGGFSDPGYPAMYSTEFGIAAGAIDSNGTLASFSNRSGALTKDFVTAAGVNIFSTIAGNRYGYMSGTSMATPYIAGAIAIARGLYPHLNPSQIENLFSSSASHGSFFQANSNLVSGFNATRIMNNDGLDDYEIIDIQKPLDTLQISQDFNSRLTNSFSQSRRLSGLNNYLSNSSSLSQVANSLPDSLIMPDLLSLQHQISSPDADTVTHAVPQKADSSNYVNYYVSKDVIVDPFAPTFEMSLSASVDFDFPQALDFRFTNRKSLS